MSELLSNYWVLMPLKALGVLLIFLVFPLLVGKTWIKDGVHPIRFRVRINAD